MIAPLSDSEAVRSASQQGYCDRATIRTGAPGCLKRTPCGSCSKDHGSHMAASVVHTTVLCGLRTGASQRHNLPADDCLQMGGVAPARGPNLVSAPNFLGDHAEVREL